MRYDRSMNLYKVLSWRGDKYVVASGLGAVEQIWSRLPRPPVNNFLADLGRGYEEDIIQKIELIQERIIVQRRGNIPDEQ